MPLPRIPSKSMLIGDDHKGRRSYSRQSSTSSNSPIDLSVHRSMTGSEEPMGPKIKRKKVKEERKEKKAKENSNVKSKVNKEKHTNLIAALQGTKQVSSEQKLSEGHQVVDKNELSPSNSSSAKLRKIVDRAKTNEPDIARSDLVDTVTKRIPKSTNSDLQSSSVLLRSLSSENKNIYSLGSLTSQPLLPSQPVLMSRFSDLFKSMSGPLKSEDVFELMKPLINTMQMGPPTGHVAADSTGNDNMKKSVDKHNDTDAQEKMETDDIPETTKKDGYERGRNDEDEKVTSSSGQGKGTNNRTDASVEKMLTDDDNDGCDNYDCESEKHDSPLKSSQGFQLKSFDLDKAWIVESSSLKTVECENDNSSLEISNQDVDMVKNSLSDVRNESEASEVKDAENSFSELSRIGNNNNGLECGNREVAEKGKHTITNNRLQPDNFGRESVGDNDSDDNHDDDGDDDIDDAGLDSNLVIDEGDIPADDTTQKHKRSNKGKTMSGKTRKTGMSNTKVKDSGSASPSVSKKTDDDKAVMCKEYSKKVNSGSKTTLNHSDSEIVSLKDRQRHAKVDCNESVEQDINGLKARKTFENFERKSRMEASQPGTLDSSEILTTNQGRALSDSGKETVAPSQLRSDPLPISNRVEEVFKQGKSSTWYFKDGDKYKPVKIFVDDSQQSTQVLQKMLQSNQMQLLRQNQPNAKVLTCSQESVPVRVTSCPASVGSAVPITSAMRLPVSQSPVTAPVTQRTSRTAPVPQAAPLTAPVTQAAPLKALVTQGPLLLVSKTRNTAAETRTVSASGVATAGAKVVSKMSVVSTKASSIASTTVGTSSSVSQRPAEDSVSPVVTVGSSVVSRSSVHPASDGSVVSCGSNAVSRESTPVDKSLSISPTRSVSRTEATSPVHSSLPNKTVAKANSKLVIAPKPLGGQPEYNYVLTEPNKYKSSPQRYPKNNDMQETLTFINPSVKSRLSQALQSPARKQGGERTSEAGETTSDVRESTTDSKQTLGEDVEEKVVLKEETNSDSAEKESASIS